MSINDSLVALSGINAPGGIDNSSHFIDTTSFVLVVQNTMS